MNEKELLQALVGWKCPCCGSVHSPDIRACNHCSPIIKLMMLAVNPELDQNYFHKCPKSKFPSTGPR